MKTAHEILGMSTYELRRLVARQQIEIARQDRAQAGGADGEEVDLCNEALDDAKQIKREIYASQRQARKKAARVWTS